MEPLTKTPTPTEPKTSPLCAATLYALADLQRWRAEKPHGEPHDLAIIRFIETAAARYKRVRRTAPNSSSRAELSAQSIAILAASIQLTEALAKEAARR